MLKVDFALFIFLMPSQKISKIWLSFGIIMNEHSDYEISY